MIPSLEHFATHEHSEYPELWDNVVGSCAPCLGPTGLRLHDHSGRNNWGNFTNIGADRWTVQSGFSAINFVSSLDQSIQVPLDQNQIAVPSTSVSVSAWCRPTGNGTAFGRDIVVKYYHSPPPYISYGLQLHSIATPNVFSFAIGTNTIQDSDYVFVSSSTSLDLNNLYHVCGTFDGANMRIYVNGRLSNTRAETRPMIFNTAPLVIGRWPGSNLEVESWIGQIYEVVIRSSVLNPNLVALEHQIGPGGMYTPKIGHPMVFDFGSALRRRLLMTGQT